MSSTKIISPKHDIPQTADCSVKCCPSWRSLSSVWILVRQTTHFKGRFRSFTATCSVLTKQRRHRTLCLQGNVWMIALALLHTIHCKMKKKVFRRLWIYKLIYPFLFSVEQSSIKCQSIICFTSNCDLLKNLVSLLQPIRAKTETKLLCPCCK